MSFKFVGPPPSQAKAWARDRGSQLVLHFVTAPLWLLPEGYVPSSERTAEEWTDGKLAECNEQIVARVSEFLAAVESVGSARGVDFMPWSVQRSLTLQLQKYCQGRTMPGRIVTKTIASLHLFGLAVDLCVRLPSGQPCFTLPKWYGKDVLPLARSHGLRSLYLEKGLDPPHFEIPPNERPQEVVEAMGELRREFRNVVFLKGKP